jgi:hypothetical protein
MDYYGLDTTARRRTVLPPPPVVHEAAPVPAPEKEPEIVQQLVIESKNNPTEIVVQEIPKVDDQIIADCTHQFN